MKTLLTLILAVLMVALVFAYQRLGAAEEPFQVPMEIDETGRFVKVPIVWFTALIDTHNQHVIQIRKLKAERCS